jgi:uroporphyrinogen-III synthase
LIFVIRPEPGLHATLAAGRELGLAMVGLPLFEVIPLAWQVPPAAQFDALLVGSANVFRHGGDRLDALLGLPVHAVGETTAEAARDRGFRVKRVGEGGLQAVLDAEREPRRYLRLAGMERVDLVVPEGSTIAAREVYEVRALPLSGSAQVSLRAGDPLVLLHSATAARHFAAEIDRLGLDRTAIRLATIGPRVTAAAGAGWAACVSAPHPSDASLLALAREMCHE